MPHSATGHVLTKDGTEEVENVWDEQSTSTIKAKRSVPLCFHPTLLGEY